MRIAKAAYIQTCQKPWCDVLIIKLNVFSD